MNCCVLAGRLTKDIEVRQTQNGKTVGSYTLAVDDGYGDQKRTLFLPCTHWQCEKIAQYMTKGKAVIVRGRLQQREFQDRDGNLRKFVELNVQESTFQQGNTQGSNTAQPNPQPRRQQQPLPPDNDAVPF